MAEHASQAHRLKALIDRAEALLRARGGADAADEEEISRLEAALARAEADLEREAALRREAADALDAAIEELKLAAGS